MAECHGDYKRSEAFAAAGEDEGAWTRRAYRQLRGRHQSEYVGESERRRQFISGFSGSAGTAFVGMEGAWLWTDSRYLLQASQQLDTSVWTVMHSLPRQASMAEHAAAELPQGSRIGADPWLLPLATYQTLQDKLSSREHVLVPLTNNLVDELWDSRPRPPKGKAFAHPVRLSGSSTKEKLERTRKELRELGASAMVISSLDEVAWLLNVRGDDIPYNPFVVSYVILTMEETKWFVDEEKVDESLRASLQDDGVSIFSYSSLEEHLVLLAKGCGSVLVDPAKCSWKVYMILTPETKEEMVEQCKVITQLSPVCTLKAIKTEEELQGFRDAHLKDAAAMVNFLCWIEKAMEDNVHLTEVSAADKLLEFRKQQQLAEIKARAS
ncbi:hypothetical protein GUITHDRAFT_116243 [Guillardia theta CCMP2712]|uniref:Creatinase N-terminal domain-containing protein n=1 Tax=Guillardia theta (strain CCMP2712) TaxID=905079 RepID=L1IMV1_GUITC|nr:hypothetical protein GUITHDRAFT_116243 [Guillardia theta CCMP2712]EKX37601.1 hypothetical protein GUITHDRAFT_116243 [Guillardia theta CCMP2712]|eukprot:XP_005824581.1 hypothetical protein GUITHDRAFT_116243 [Guillardia theta CCMP2712]